MKSEKYEVSHYVSEGKRYQEEILNFILVEGGYSFFDGMKDLLMKTDDKLIEFFVDKYNATNLLNIDAYINSYCFLLSMSSEEKKIFADKIRDIICDEFSSGWKNYLNELVDYLNNEADEDVVRTANILLDDLKALIIHLHNSYNVKNIEDNGAMRMIINPEKLDEIIQDENTELIDIIVATVVENCKKLENKGMN